ncbi:hypothetical protein [Chryseobacterium sp.]|uniref:hypothetical protein n=1 Tax=Chryseobacterium sp. TaxID=1871047 RepID=UPI0025BAB076|nr:hypothetical protein [Chryseobacterium sp.]MBV8324999.1 hypothetical protein [Chryseobacterium sp.]
MKINENCKINFNNVSLADNGKELVMEYEGKCFVINDFIFSIIHFLKKENNIDSDKVYEKFSLNQEEFDFVLSNIEEKLQVKETKSKGGIFFRFTIFRKNHVNTITDLLKHLIPKKESHFFMLFVLIFSLFISAFIFETNSAVGKNYLKITNKYEVFYLYLSIFFASVFHEFGHASAAKRFRLTPGEIGFGFFFIFPVFYSNVTTIWTLDKMKRIVVNLSGIYYQLIFAILIFLFVKDTNFIILFLKANLAIIIFSLLPFLKNDGYWVLSDYFDLKGLYGRSYTYLISLWRGNEKFNNFLFIYSIIHFCMVFYLLFTFLRFFILKVINIYTLTPSLEFDYFLTVGKFIFNLFILYTLSLRLLTFFNTPKNV